MDDKSTEADPIDQRRDAMLLRALKTPPQPRPKRVREKNKSSAAHIADAGVGKPLAPRKPHRPY